MRQVDLRVDLSEGLLDYWMAVVKADLMDWQMDTRLADLMVDL